MPEFWRQRSLNQRILIVCSIGTLVGIVLVHIFGAALESVLGLEGAKLTVGVTLLALGPVVAAVLAVIHYQVVRPARVLAEIVDELAQGGQLVRVRDRLRPLLRSGQGEAL